MSTDVSTTRLLYVPDWRTKAVRRLLVAWNGPNSRAWIEALATGVQAFEDVAFDVLSSTYFQNSTGDALDQWGALVNEQRLGLSDDEYRNFISARMLANRSNGRDDELIELFQLLTSPFVDLFMVDYLPACFVLTVVRRDFMSDEFRKRVGRTMQRAKTSGRTMVLIESVAEGFGFQGDPTATGYDVGPLSRLIEVS